MVPSLPFLTQSQAHAVLSLEEDAATGPPGLLITTTLRLRPGAPTFALGLTLRARSLP